MKKCLAVLVALLVFSVVPTAFAAEVSVNVTASTIDESTGVFYLAVQNAVKAKSGILAIDFDETKVSLYDQDGGETLANADDAVYCCVAQNSCSFSAVDASITDGYINVEWFNTSGVRANRDIVYIYFVTTDKKGDTFNNETFKLLTDAEVLSSLKLTGNGGNAQLTDENSIKYSAESTENTIAVNFTYPNSTVSAGGNTTTSWKDEVKYEVSESIKFPTTKDEVTADTPTGTLAGNKIVVFAKNTTALTGTEDGEANYGITVGGKYYPGYLSVPANSSWAIILADPNSNILNGTYSVSITAEGETITGTAQTVSAN